MTSDSPTQLVMQPEEKPPNTYRRIGEIQRMMGVNMFTHHIPRTLEPTIMHSREGSLNPGRAVALVVQENGYSYCPPDYADYTVDGLKQANYMMACFPKEDTPCLENELGKPEGFLQDAVEALQYLAKEGF